jgi:hypothetical protein
VHRAERVECGFHDLRSTIGRGDRRVVGDGLSAGRLDFLNDLIGHARPGTGSVTRAAEVVDDDERAVVREEARV